MIGDDFRNGDFSSFTVKNCQHLQVESLIWMGYPLILFCILGTFLSWGMIHLPSGKKLWQFIMLFSWDNSRHFGWAVASIYLGEITSGYMMWTSTHIYHIHNIHHLQSRDNYQKKTQAEHHSQMMCCKMVPPQ